MTRPTWLVFAALAAFAVTSPAARAQGTPASKTVDVMNQIWGRHPGARANHAKGIVAEGTFLPTAEAAKLSKAPIFAGKPVPVTVRFSDSTGLPAIPDATADANPHGMGLQFRPEGAGEVDVVLNSLGFFPVRTGEEFLQLLQAGAASPPDAPKPTEVERFIASHPAVPKAFATVHTPTSFAREVYNGVDAFVFVAADGTRQPFRFHIVPGAGTEYMTAEQASAAAPDALLTELPQRLAKGPVAFRVLAQLPGPGDAIDDATQPWPADRKFADLGTLTVTRPAPDNAKAESALHLLPNRLEPGIELSDDPLIMARVQAYLISFGRRAQ